ncbi:MAG: hypothetical protein ABIT04_08505 [Novosphingobium sp.]
MAADGNRGGALAADLRNRPHQFRSFLPVAIAVRWLTNAEQCVEKVGSDLHDPARGLKRLLTAHQIYRFLVEIVLTAGRVRNAINRRMPGTATFEDGVTIALRLPPGAARAPAQGAGGGAAALYAG